MTINDRIKEIRKELKMTQVDFGKRICISQGQLTSIENGKRNVTDRTIKMICTEFNVSEQWLRTGAGDRRIQPDVNSIDALVMQYDFPDIVRKLLETYEQLDREERAVMTAFTRKFLASLAPDPIEQKVEAYRAELQAQEREKTSSASRTDDEKNIG